MPQKDFDELMKLTPSRYALTMVVSRRAAQLKYGVTNTLTKKPIPREKNAVSAAMEELVTGSGVRWGDNLPTQEEILRFAQAEHREQRDKPAGAFTVTRRDVDDADADDDEPIRGPYRPKF